VVSAPVGAAPSREQLWAWLDEVKDPEIPVLSVVELGIVRDVAMDDSGATVTITPTYSGCPAMHAIEEAIVETLASHGVAPVRVRTTYAPAWTTDWIAESAKAKLEAYGIAPPHRLEPGDDLIPLRSRRAATRCPYCKSLDTALESEFGSTSCKAIYVCRECRQPFEMFKAI
jgi:ring-1,2-phenylacetyl-CoA epoxidase subunit PaaD